MQEDPPLLCEKFNHTSIKMISIISSILFSVLPIAYFVYKLIRCGSEIPSHLPWVGQDVKGPFKRTRSYLRSIFGTKAMLDEGYEKYSRHGQAFVLPNLFTGAEILLPPSYFDWSECSTSSAYGQITDIMQAS